MKSRSRPIFSEFVGQNFSATCSLEESVRGINRKYQEPGAAQRSIRTFVVFKKLYFEFS